MDPRAIVDAVAAQVIFVVAVAVVFSCGAGAAVTWFALGNLCGG